jgi:hypothetical protein
MYLNYYSQNDGGTEEISSLTFRINNKSEYKKASEQLGNIYYDLLKEEAEFSRNIPEEYLNHELLEKHYYNTKDPLEILAELFNAEADLCLSQNDKPGAFSY